MMYNTDSSSTLLTQDKLFDLFHRKSQSKTICKELQKAFIAMSKDLKMFSVINHIQFHTF